MIIMPLKLRIMVNITPEIRAWIDSQSFDFNITAFVRQAFEGQMQREREENRRDDPTRETRH